jgi:hypothetical protein
MSVAYAIRFLLIPWNIVSRIGWNSGGNVSVSLQKTSQKCALIPVHEKDMVCANDTSKQSGGISQTGIAFL